MNVIMIKMFALCYSINLQTFTSIERLRLVIMTIHTKPLAMLHEHTYLKVSDSTIRLEGSSRVQHSPVIERHGLSWLQTMVKLQDEGGGGRGRGGERERERNIITV